MTMIDVFVVGSGIAGLSAAIAAAEAGAGEVMVAEAEGVVGGSSRLSGGIVMAAGSLERDAGISDDGDALFHDYMALNQWRLDAGVVRRFANESGAALDWLVDMGVEFYPQLIFGGDERVPRLRQVGRARAGHHRRPAPHMPRTWDRHRARSAGRSSARGGRGRRRRRRRRRRSAGRLGDLGDGRFRRQSGDAGQVVPGGHGDGRLDVVHRSRRCPWGCRDPREHRQRPGHRGEPRAPTPARELRADHRPVPSGLGHPRQP